MPRTKRRTVKRSSSDMNMTYGNVTSLNQPKNIKEILEEFDSESIYTSIKFFVCFLIYVIILF